MNIKNQALIIVFLLLVMSVGFGFVENREIIEKTRFNVSDYGAFPNDGKDDTESLRTAVALARAKTGSILFFPPGRYLISDSLAIKIQNDALSGKLGKNPQNQLFVPNKEYVIGLDLLGANNLEIQAKDVHLICDGWMEPLSFRNAQNIILNGITIDYKRRPNNEGEIIKLGDDFVDVKFQQDEILAKNQIVLRIMIYDKIKKSFSGAGVYQKRMEWIDKHTIRFYGDGIRNQAKIGDILITYSGFHYRPAILIYKTKNIVLNDVTINSQAGMGIVGHLNQNITMNRLKVVPAKGRHVSTNTDATHFSTNRGLIRFDDCEFGGQGDDATNVHTYYTHILNNDPSKKQCDIAVDRKNYTHSSYLDEPMDNDVMAIVKKSTLEEVGYVKVRRFWPHPLQDKVTIQYDGKLPKKTDDYYLINISTTPKLEFVNCIVRSHRARSVLVKTRKVLIKDNHFENTTGTAIHVGTEGDWGEGPASEDVVIENNEFINCGLGGPEDGTMDGASAIALHVKAPTTNTSGLHKRILMQGNTISGGKHAIAVKGSAEVTIRNNEFTNISQNPIMIGASVRVKAYKNIGGDPIGKDEKDPILPNLIY
ncbi:right-handed parallel beta-helix repeat-containing protein [Arenibacter sp. ARW7G5Y1]|uniref:right-handed parallel beta-helix repeat-containing protein n=1 Tax=Arenibacter sp. ARW7G5Y1 TaxID=2135619 RepID=UPI000D771AF4|nr:right-handed parallel beta-helix repeat-containing protein [Arenibacter sp. ARW7G5Y1]PXX31183.1 pectate lyase-like protein [Arenibacter sp. ARW7G5Y1]